MTQTIGQRLKQARQEKRLTLEKVFEAIRIRVQYLEALEMDDLSSMPSPVQARGYLRNYAEYLGLDFEQLLDEARAGHKPSDEIIAPEDLTARPTTSAPQEPLPVEDGSPPPAPEPDSPARAESQPEPVPVKTPKRRARKKVEPEPEPVIEPAPEPVEEPVAGIEPVREEPAAPQEEAVHPPDVSESLWQTWLNRLSSVIPARAPHKEEAQPEPDVLQDRPQSVSTPVDFQESNAIFKEIGIELRKRRELLSLHLDEVERNTHVKAHYLEALEAGAMDDLPSTVQTRGMLSNYANFLDLDVDALLLRYADALQARHREKNPQLPTRKPGQPIIPNVPSIRNFIAGDMIFGVGVAVLLIGFSIWGVSRVMTIQSQREIQPTAPSISDVLLASPDPSSVTATPTLKPVGGIPGQATVTIVIPTQNLNVQVQMNLVAVERSYMRVIADGKVAFEGRVVPGTAYPFEAEDQIEILVGSGAAIRVVYNGRDLGLMGTFGQVVNNIYTAQEIITPTALPAPTITNTVPPSPTLRPTRTPVPTNTPNTPSP